MENNIPPIKKRFSIDTDTVKRSLTISKYVEKGKTGITPNTTARNNLVRNTLTLNLNGLSSYRSKKYSLFPSFMKTNSSRSNS
jgi:hypothetical protein